MARVKVIAEIGSNWRVHDSLDVCFDEANRLIAWAAEAGADIVKLQLFEADSLYSKDRVPDLWQRARKYQMPLDWVLHLYGKANRCGVDLWASVFSTDIIPDVLAGLDGLKIASGDLVYDDLILQASRACRARGIPLAISTGAATDYEVYHASTIPYIDETDENRFPKLILMHCVSAYPTDDRYVNLLAGRTFAHLCDEIGFSDHTQGNRAAMIAVGLGYTYFEKHMRGYDYYTGEAPPDFDVSFSPELFKEYVDSIHLAETMVGEKRKRVMPIEISERKWARRGSDNLRPVD